LFGEWINGVHSKLWPLTPFQFWDHVISLSVYMIYNYFCIRAKQVVLFSPKHVCV